MTTKKQLKITLVRSTAGRLPRHRATVACLGLRRLRQSVQLTDTPSIRGMINRVGYLLEVEEAK